MRHSSSSLYYGQIHEPTTIQCNLQNMYYFSSWQTHGMNICVHFGNILTTGQTILQINVHGLLQETKIKQNISRVVFSSYRYLAWFLHSTTCTCTCMCTNMDTIFTDILQKVNIWTLRIVQLY